MPTEKLFILSLYMVWEQLLDATDKVQFLYC